MGSAVTLAHYMEIHTTYLLNDKLHIVIWHFENFPSIELD